MRVVVVVVTLLLTVWTATATPAEAQQQRNTATNNNATASSSQALVCAANAASHARTLNLTRTLYPYAFSHSDEESSEKKARAVMYRAEPACAWAIPSYLKNVDKNTYDTVMTTYAMQNNNNPETIKLALASQCVSPATCETMVNGAYQNSLRPAVLANDNNNNNNMPLLLANPRDTIPRMAVPFRDIPLSIKQETATAATADASSSTLSCSGTSPIVDDQLIRAATMRAAVALNTANISTIVDRTAGMHFVPPRLVRSAYRDESAEVGCGCCIFSIADNNINNSSDPSPKLDEEALQARWSRLFDSLKEELNSPIGTPRTAEEENNNNDNTSPAVPPPPSPPPSPPPRTPGRGIADNLVGGNYGGGGFTGGNGGFVGGGGGGFAPRPPPPPPRPSFEKDYEDYEDSATTEYYYGTEDDDESSVEEEEENPLLTPCLDAPFGDAERVFDYTYGECHWQYTNNKNVGQNGRSVTIISCDEGEEQGTGPNGEILHNKVFRDGKADEPNVFYPEQYGRLVWFQDANDPDEFWACEIAFNRDSPSDALTANREKINAENPASFGCDQFPWTHLVKKSHPLAQQLLASTDEVSCEGNEKAG
ncbi:hypothetical protein NFJ02_13g14170 [Pycnococcus provasolii]